MLNAPRPQSNRAIVPEGTHIARVIGFIHVGTAEDSFKGEKKMFNKIRLTWEFPEETHVFKEGDVPKPFVHSEEYTFSMGKKSNLLPIIEGMIGTSLSEEEAYNFNFESLIGLACIVSIKYKKSSKGNVFPKVGSTTSLMKGQVCKDAFNPYKVLTFENWDEEYFNSLPEFIKDKIKRSEEYKSMKGIIDPISSDGIPF